MPACCIAVCLTGVPLLPAPTSALSARRAAALAAPSTARLYLCHRCSRSASRCGTAPSGVHAAAPAPTPLPAAAAAAAAAADAAALMLPSPVLSCPMKSAAGSSAISTVPKRSTWEPWAYV